MPGFDSSSPGRDSSVGYRSVLLMGNGPVSYNGFVFPPALHSGVIVEPEYDEANWTLKWINVTVQIEFIYTLPNKKPSELYEQGYDAESFALTIPTMVRLLSEPCQPLQFIAQGFGNFTVNGGGTQDVHYGPKPQILQYEPLGGGNCARVSWACTTRVSQQINQSSFDVIGGYSYEMNWTLDESGFMSRTINGSITIPQTRGQQGPGSAAVRLSLRTWQALRKLKEENLKTFPLVQNFKRSYSYEVSRNKSVINFEIRDTELATDEYYPPGAINCNVSRTVSSDHDNGFTKWLISINGSIDVVNAKRTGFGISSAKIVCWLYILKILKTIRSRFEQVLGSSLPEYLQQELGQQQNDEIDPADLGSSFPAYPPHSLNSTGQYKEEEKKVAAESVYYMPVSVSVTDDIFANSISFSIVYEAVVGSDLIMYATGMFQPLGIDQQGTESWVSFLNNSGVYDESLDPSIRSQAVIVDLCNPLNEQPVTDNSTNTAPSTSLSNVYYLNSSHEFSGTQSIANNTSWTSFHNEFSFYSSTGLQLAQKLSEDDLSKTDQLYYSKEDVRERDPGGMFGGSNPWKDFTSAAQAKEQPKLATFRNKPDTCYVRMKGYASRLGKHIIVPKLIGIGKGLVYDSNTGKVIVQTTDPRTGKAYSPLELGAIAYPLNKGSKIVPTRLNLAENSGKKIKWKCEATWDLWYVLERIPFSGEIVTTGNPLKVRQ